MTEVRQTDPDTGGQKGMKPEAFAFIPWDVMREVARTYHYGASKYDDPSVGAYNWKRGYAWSLSFSAMMRHITAFWEGEDKDSESGLHHLAHAAWHCLALMWFGMHGKGTDDRSTVLREETSSEEIDDCDWDDVVAEWMRANPGHPYSKPDADPDAAVRARAYFDSLGSRGRTSSDVFYPGDASKAPTPGG